MRERRIKYRKMAPISISLYGTLLYLSLWRQLWSEVTEWYETDDTDDVSTNPGPPTTTSLFLSPSHIFSHFLSPLSLSHPLCVSLSLSISCPALVVGVITPSIMILDTYYYYYHICSQFQKLAVSCSVTTIQRSSKNPSSIKSLPLTTQQGQWLCVGAVIAG